MINISRIGESLQLNEENQYIIIDALYLNEIQDKIENLDKDNLLEDIRNKVFGFPFTDTPFAELGSNRGELLIGSIKVIDNEKSIIENKNRCFSTDTGLLIVIWTKIIEEFLSNYDYEQLVDSDTSPINREYWEKISGKFNSKDLALILTPGMDSGFEFEGSGIYIVT